MATTFPIPEITSETRLNSTSTNPTLDNSPVQVQEVNKLIVAVNDLSDGSQPFAEHITDNTQSTSSSTGALIVDGGVGIAKNLNVGAVIVEGTTDSTTTTTGSLKTAGGLGVVKNITAGGTIKNTDTTDSTTKDTGAITTEGGVGVEKAIFAGTTINAGTKLTTGESGATNTAGTIFAGFYPATAQQALSGAGAINITAYYTAWTTTGANAGTLANATIAGQLKKITMVVDGGDGTLTPTSLSGGTTITFNDAADYVILMWNGTAWVVIENSGTTIA